MAGIHEISENQEDDKPEAEEKKGHGGEQRVTWPELFFDLVWVFVVTQTAAVLAHVSGPAGAARVLLLFVPLWWCWVGATFLGNAAGERIDTPRGRLILFLMAGCGLSMAVAVSRVAEDSGAWLFAGAHAVLWVLLWSELRRQAAGIPGSADVFRFSLFVGAPLYLVGAGFHGTVRDTLWAAGSAALIAGPVLMGRKVSGMRVESSHLPERFGLFLIIAIGETVVALGGAADDKPLHAPVLSSLAVAFAMIVLLWWTYFHFGAPAVQHSLETDPEQGRIVRNVVTYAHTAYVLALICVAVGLKKLIAYPLEPSHGTPALLLAPGVCLYLFGFCYARWQMFGSVRLPRFAGGLAAAVLAFTAAYIPALVTAGLLTAVLAGVNGAEAWLVAKEREVPKLRFRKRPASQQGTDLPV